MLLSSVTRDHPNNDVVLLCKGYVLVREVMIWLGECLSDDVLVVTAKHEMKETFSCLVKIPGKRKTLI